MPVCTDCGGNVIEYDTAAGNGFCVQCGTVLEENTIVNEVTFGETSTGAAMVQGSFVAQGATHARMGGPFGNRGNSESREQTIANAQRRIQQIAAVMRLSEVVQHAATRLYTLAVEHKFTKGRKSMNVLAVCLYVACRQKETRNYMLIDFSDLLQVNVFELGHTYLQLVQTLNLRLPLVDPSHYISRFAALLEFGDETPQVALDATRLVQRFDRDWMTRGRRPSGICGAALLLAARMNNFRRSIEEIVQVVKIADTTLKKRVEEFRKTGSANLSVADFRSVWLEDEMDPPAFTKGREKEAAEAAAVNGEDEDDDGGAAGGKKGKGKAKAKKGKRKKRKRGEETEDEQQAKGNAVPEQEPPRPQPIDPALLNQGILAGTVMSPPLAEEPQLNGNEVQNGAPHRQPLFLPDDGEDPPQHMQMHDPNAFIDPALLDPSLLPPHLTSMSNGVFQAPPPQQISPPQQESHQEQIPIPEQSTESTVQPLTTDSTLPVDAVNATLVEPTSPEAGPSKPIKPSPSSSSSSHNLVEPAPPSPVEQAIDNLLTEEVSSFLTSGKAAEISSELAHAEQARLAKIAADDELAGLDEDELDAFILTEEEVKIKERVWVELNKEYLEALAAKAELEAVEGSSGEKKSRKRRKTGQNNKPRDASTPHGSTAAESVQNFLKKNPKYSKRINYDALKDLFTDTGSPAPGLHKMSKTPTPGPRLRDEDEDEEDKEDEYELGLDDKSDGEGMSMVVVEESGGAVGAATKSGSAVGDVSMADDDDMYAEGSDKGEEYGDWDAYEQEV
ncbi:BRF1-domain-containing protein [Panus rudis PR-1116 ss-1]|nr:BRF1-domain-containing protein [Panus rudis PR-1116 ss-1]